MPSPFVPCLRAPPSLQAVKDRSWRMLPQCFVEHGWLLHLFHCFAEDVQRPPALSQRQKVRAAAASKSAAHKLAEKLRKRKQAEREASEAARQKNELAARAAALGLPLPDCSNARLGHLPRRHLAYPPSVGWPQRRPCTLYRPRRS